MHSFNLNILNKSLLKLFVYIEMSLKNLLDQILKEHKKEYVFLQVMGIIPFPGT